MPYGSPRNNVRSLRRVRRSTNTPGRGSIVDVARVARMLSGPTGRQLVGRVTRAASNILRRRNPAPKRSKRGPVKGRRNDLVLTSDHTGMAQKDLGVVKLGKQPKIGKMLGVYYFNNHNQWVVQSIEGKQAVDFPEVLFTRDQLAGLNLSNVRSERYRWPTSLYNLNPYAPRPATTPFPGPHTEIAKADVCYIKSVNIHFKMLSMVTVPQEVLVYWVMPVFDTDTNPIDSWVQVLAGKNDGALVQAPSSTLAQNNAGYGGSEFTDMNANPFHHREFRSTWNCIKSSKVLLQPGEQVDLRFKIEFEKIINKQTLTEVRKMQFLAGLTVFPMIIARCGLIGLREAAIAPASEITHAPGKVGIWQSHQIKCGALGASRLSTGLTYEGTLAASAAEKTTINDQDEVVLMQTQ